MAPGGFCHRRPRHYWRRLFTMALGRQAGGVGRDVAGHSFRTGKPCCHPSRTQAPSDVLLHPTPQPPAPQAGPARATKNAPKHASGSSRLLFGSIQGKIRAAHIVPRLLAWANTRAVVSADGHHGRQGTLRADRRTDRQSPWSDSGTSLEAGACAKTSEPNYKHGRWYTNRMRSLASYKWWRQGRAPLEH